MLARRKEPNPARQDTGAAERTRPKNQEIKMSHGGLRHGAGRPKGSRNKATNEREKLRREAPGTPTVANANLGPIDFLLQVMRDPAAPPGRPARPAIFVAPLPRSAHGSLPAATSRLLRRAKLAVLMPGMTLSRARALQPGQ